MNTAYDYAKYFVSKGLDSSPNTFDGNMKLQKLLVFADLISMAKFGRPLFEDKIMAFTNGYVVEEIRKKYQYQYFEFKADSDTFVPTFSDDEETVLDYTIGIYGSLSAKTLSDLSHDFEFWSDSYNNGLDENGYHNKDRSVITIDAMMKEIDSIRRVVMAYEQNCKIESSYQIINGIRFYYSPQEVDMTESLLEYLVDFSQSANEMAYSIYYDEGNLVVY